MRPCVVRTPRPSLSAGHLGKILHLPDLSVPIREVGTLAPTLWDWGTVNRANEATVVYSSRTWILASGEVPVKSPCHGCDTEATEPVLDRTALQTVPWETFSRRARLCAERSPPVRLAKFTCRCS
uniref:Uncharacterized protein n=1 Tax=Molossus molossus TaxID=27622 RepID=A0A7J8CZP7_MOLMO|nr:hypothetical protein HJG59_009499 [Molossus molossus]